MEHKCNCYHKESKKMYTYHPVTGQPIEHDVGVGICWGTKEMDECNCGGNKLKCDFYPEVREEAKTNATIQEAINHYNYGISHDIFKEPVTSYAKMSVEALGKQIPKEPLIWKDTFYYAFIADDDWGYECPNCGSREIDYPDHHCTCGQTLNWDNIVF